MIAKICFIAILMFCISVDPFSLVPMQPGAFGASSQTTNNFAFVRKPGSLSIQLGGQPVGDYVFEDEQTPRPFFTRLRTGDGTQVTRNHPPVAGVDAMDHAKLHPGLWLAFGDLNGVDFWRNRGRIEHVRFTEEPRVVDGRLTFAVEEKYLGLDGEEVCRGHNVFCFVDGKTMNPPQPGTLLMWKATLQSDDGPLVFGPQHEMGLGYRVETSMVVDGGQGGQGQITGSHGGQNELGNWGRTARWWDYSAVIDGRRQGIFSIVADDNSRDFWAHARDYGFLAMNPTGPPPDRKDVASIGFTVAEREPFEMTFGVMLYSAAVTEGSVDAGMPKPEVVREVLKRWKESLDKPRAP